MKVQERTTEERDFDYSVGYPLYYPGKSSHGPTSRQGTITGDFATYHLKGHQWISAGSFAQGRSLIGRIMVKRCKINDPNIFWVSACYPEPSRIKVKKNDRHELELEKFRIAKEQFMEKLPELSRHPGKYVAVTHEGFYEFGDDKVSLRNLMIEKYGYSSMYITKIGEKKRVMRDRRPKLVRK